MAGPPSQPGMYAVLQACADDADAIAPLFDAYRVFWRQASNIKASEAFLRERMSRGESVVFKCVESVTDKVAGFTQLYPLFSSTRMAKLWILNDIYVSEAYRGLGCSKLLISAAQQLAHESGACEILLETERTNVAGNSLYVKTGFKLDTEINLYRWGVPGFQGPCAER